MPARRLCPAVLAALFVLALPVPAASANVYPVYSCWDATNNSWAGFASGGLAAFAACPGRDDQYKTTGLVARAQPGGNGGRVPA
ncbi:MAG: hypothetical protein ACR2NH_04600, partial [Solirubrobacteraceae bacterium]